MCATDRHDVTLGVKVALNPNTTNQPVIPSFVHVCIYFEWFSLVAIFRTGFSFVEYFSGSFRAFLQSDY